MSTRMSFTTKKEADDFAARVHAAMRLSNKLYRDSCNLYDRFGGAKGGTRAWAKAHQDKDKNGVPINTLWHIDVDWRPRKVMTKAETDTIPEWKTATPTVSAQQQEIST